ncbi:MULTISPECIES: CaiB/BaiF CoA-transferase family protein [unclassified Crossiella]|uniref:CaiB/BaiF CoA transferase family protein n=1 Tax=unclassified Crossiella TaxID=2620835 RepID=UPI001FFF6C2E|nr:MULTISPECIES: CaiB/BaiF CoA-transferase family protein [unclassified Crossiella]MCK2241170.1 CoA transferase [Crossiella sp. S99.2]MCK2253686.1 CoA transferase [Crossiella sp. S99.1]
MQPLEGTTVLAIEQAVAVPYATRLLADLGARVIKIERPGTGDFARGYDTACGPVSSYFAWVNLGKESLTLDLKHPDGRAVLDRLLDRVDVVLCNLSPAAARRLDLDADTLRAHRPGLIAGELSGYGEEGPYATRKAYDALIQSEAGLIELTGEGEVTGRAGISVADIAAGVQLHAAVLAALLRQARTGEGATLRLTLLEALAEWMHQPMLYATGTGVVPPRTGAHHASIAPYGPFRCGDGDSVHLAVQNEGQWRRLCAVTGQPGLAADPRFGTVADRVARRAELHAELQPAFDRTTAADLLAALDAADVPAARTRTVLDLAEHPQLAVRDRWAQVPVPGGTAVRMLRPPVDDSGSAWAPAPVPDLGQHNDLVLDWLGYHPEEINNLRRNAVI